MKAWLTQNRSPNRLVLGVLGCTLSVIGGALTVFFLIHRSGQSRVSPGVLPLVVSASVADVYVDCSQLGGITYIADNPCETFMLVHSSRFVSATALLKAEARRLTAAGWHHPSIAPDVDYDAQATVAPISESWDAPTDAGCAYVATDQVGFTEEAKGLFPYDPYNQTHGVLAFYRMAKAADRRQTLWVRLRPSAANYTEAGAC